MRTRIEQAVFDGTMTQAKADWLLEGLDKGYLDGPGFGFGFGGHGGHGGPDGAVPLFNFNSSLDPDHSLGRPVTNTNEE